MEGIAEVVLGGTVSLDHSERSCMQAKGGYLHGDSGGGQHFYISFVIVVPTFFLDFCAPLLSACMLHLFAFVCFCWHGSVVTLV